MMLEIMSSISDEKKTPDIEDEKVAEAEALASEALRLAEEARRAAERLREVRASLLLISKDRPKPEEKAVEEDKAKPELTVEVEEPANDQQKETPVENVSETPRTQVSPTGSMASPVSILKSEASEKGERSEPKGVRYAPDTVDPVQIKKAAEAKKIENDPIVKFYDAVGIDKICGLQMDEQEEELRPKKQGLSKEALAAMLDKSLASASEESQPVQSQPAAEKPQPLSPTKRSILARKFAMVTPDPFESEFLEVADSMDQSEIAVGRGVQPKPATPAPVSPPAESAAKPVIEEPETARPKAVDPPSTKEVEESSEVEAPKELPAVEESPEVEAPKELPSVVAEAPKAAQTVVAETPVTTEKPATVEPAAKEEPAAVEAEFPELETVKTPDDQPIAALESMKSLSPYQQALLARKYNTLGDKADPFSGEDDGMDFINCGSGDACGHTEFPQEEQVEAVLKPSSSLICGWGL